METLYVILGYLSLLIVLGLFSSRFFKGTSKDYFVASNSIGPFLLLMSIFGTTMTAFALVGSTGKAYQAGIGVYGLMASWSGLIHSAVFFFVGIKIWSLGQKHGYLTQIEFFRDRFESKKIGYLLFPILVGLVVPYLLISVLAAGSAVQGITKGGAIPKVVMLKKNPKFDVSKVRMVKDDQGKEYVFKKSGAMHEMFPSKIEGVGAGIPPWITSLVICCIVLFYVFFGGLRGTAWANTFQTIVFMVMGFVAFYVIAGKLGGVDAATAKLVDMDSERLARGEMNKWMFASYMFIPLSVGMFPHLFQHFLTAKSAKSFKLSVIAHPIFIMLTWVPCILIGIWAVGVFGTGTPPNVVLGKMVGMLTGPVLAGFLGAGILAAIMSSLDSQFLCLGTMFTNDIVFHAYGEDRFTDKQKILIARAFIVLIVAITYLLSLLEPRGVFTLGIWCFSGFASLFPLIFAALYWKGVTKAGAYACVIVATTSWVLLFAKSGFGEKGGEEFLIGNMMPVATMFISSALALVVVSKFTQKLSDETLKKFFKEV
jgi:SSS family solute:Na+ symporter